MTKELSFQNGAVADAKRKLPTCHACDRTTMPDWSYCPDCGARL